jgi:chromosome segregation ATPase
MNLDNNKRATDYISEAYVPALKAIQDKAKQMENPSDIIAKEKVENTIKLADEVINMNILNSETTSEYTQLNDSIQAKKDEIAKIYGIEIFPESLQAIKDAYATLSNDFAEYLQNRTVEFEESQQQQLEEVKAKIQEDTDANDVKVEAIYEEISNKVATNKQDTKREQDAYAYNLQRARKQAKEERAKLIEDREKAMQLEEQEVQDKKQACLDKLQEIAELQAKVDDIPNLIEKATLEGATEKEKELGKDYGYKSAISKKDFDNEIANLQSEYDRLKQKYDQVCDEKQALSTKLDKCYAESRQLATDTVKSTGGINILNSDNRQYNPNNGKK